MTKLEFCNRLLIRIHGNLQTLYIYELNILTRLLATSTLILHAFLCSHFPGSTHALDRELIMHAN